MEAMGADAPAAAAAARARGDPVSAAPGLPGDGGRRPPRCAADRRGRSRALGACTGSGSCGGGSPIRVRGSNALEALRRGLRDHGVGGRVGASRSTTGGRRGTYERLARARGGAGAAQGRRHRCPHVDLHGRREARDLDDPHRVRQPTPIRSGADHAVSLARPGGNATGRHDHHERARPPRAWRCSRKRCPGLAQRGRPSGTRTTPSHGPALKVGRDQPLGRWRLQVHPVPVRSAAD